ncbi:hypothetical protein ACTWPB_08080 [Nocardia sp. IBHARD005]|uniref:hypothetical protein n=1 Tax=Nocardia sp. IBHARD005 TaxID=3457765 RepID=UPI004058471D
MRTSPFVQAVALVAIVIAGTSCGEREDVARPSLRIGDICEPIRDLLRNDFALPDTEATIPGSGRSGLQRNVSEETNHSVRCSYDTNGGWDTDGREPFDANSVVEPAYADWTSDEKRKWYTARGYVEVPGHGHEVWFEDRRNFRDYYPRGNGPANIIVFVGKWSGSIHLSPGRGQDMQISDEQINSVVSLLVRIVGKVDAEQSL